MMMIGETIDSDARPQHNLQEPQASLDVIVSALNQSRPHMAGLSPGFSSNGLHSKLSRASHGRIEGSHQLGFSAGSGAVQERVDWVSGCREFQGNGEIGSRVSEKRVSGSVKEMGSSSVGGSQDLLEKQMGVKNKGLLTLSETNLGKFAETHHGGAMEVSGKADKRSCLEMHNAGAKMVYEKCSLKVQVIDETALLETVFSVPKAGNGRGKEMGFAGSAKESEKKILDEEKAKQLRGKGKVARKAFDSNRRHKNLIHMAKAQRGAKRVYSRKEVEVLRFVQVTEQQKIWKEIYIGLGPSVAREYDDLASVRHQKQVPSFDPRQQRYGKNQAPGILGVASRGRGYHTNVFVH